ncbi:CRTAC1 family protein [Candidatus Poribacteria bacterium]|nr:CRTAC1 family protein [Candidatus Poribacteria bacterium]
MRCFFCFLLSLVVMIPPLQSEVKFADVTKQAGINFTHFDGRTGEKYLIETLGSGALFLDYDSDSYLDLYVINASNIPPNSPFPEDLSDNTQTPFNRLYQNNGDGTFTDKTEEAGIGDSGYGVGCAAADINNDGLIDIFITNFGMNRLYLNNGDGTFADITEQGGVGDERWGTGCAFLDYDLDGYVDLYVVNYMKYSVQNDRGWESRGLRIYCSPVDQMDRTQFQSEPDILYRNNGDGTFSETTKSAGIQHRSLGLAVAIGDYNNDGYPDIHIANDMEPDILYRNNGDGTFIDTTDLTGTGYDESGIPGSGMGSAFGDYNNDGFLDLIVSNAPTQPVILFKNEESIFFQDTSFPSGIGAITLPYFKWAVEFIDINNDGLLDIYVCNGHLQDNIHQFADDTYQQVDLLFQNNYQNGKYTFQNISQSTELARFTNTVGRAASFGDYDNDGDIDVFLNHSNQSAKLLRNDGGNTQNWIIINAIGTKSNRSGIGTKIYVKTEELSLYREIHSGSSYLSQNDLRSHFGLGNNTTIETLELHWTSGKKDFFRNIKSNQILTIKEGYGIVKP